MTEEKEVGSFEDALNKLEQIVNTLERGDASLEESLRLFQEATRLSKWCYTKLEKAQKQLKTLIPDNGDFRLEETDAGEN